MLEKLILQSIYCLKKPREELGNPSVNIRCFNGGTGKAIRN